MGGLQHIEDIVASDCAVSASIGAQRTSGASSQFPILSSGLGVVSVAHIEQHAALDGARNYAALDVFPGVVGPLVFMLGHVFLYPEP